MTGFQPHEVRATYDAVAEQYAAEFGDDLDTESLDRAMLADLAPLAAGGTVLDLGCGPGQASGLLQAHGVRVVGVDLALGMLQVARQRTPGLPVLSADLRALPFADSSCTGAVAFWTLQHLPRPLIAPTVAELARVLAPGGLLLLAVHLGEGEVHLDEWWGRPVSLGGTFLSPREVHDAVTGAGLEVVNGRERPAQPHEYPSERLLLLARKLS